MEKQTDLRVVRTRQMIKDAFFDLMETIGFTKITVENLSKKAFISRNTFYLHYKDKFDLLEQIENDVLTKVHGIVNELPLKVIQTKDFHHEEVQQIVHHLFKYIQENHRFFALILSKNGDPAFMYKLGEMIRGIIHSRLQGQILRVPERYMIAIIIGIQTSILGEWLSGGMKETPEELADMLAMVFRDVPRNLLGNNAEPSCEV